MKALASACALILFIVLGSTEGKAQSPSEVRERIAQYFRGAHYKEFQVQAIIRHAEIESDFQPCVIGTSGSSYLFQWLGERLTRLYQRAGHRFCPTLETQLAFADGELKSEPMYACFWRAPNFATALAALRRGFGRGKC
jgi:hypothetical protein